MRTISDQLREERRDRTYSDSFYWNPLVHGKIREPRRTLREIPSIDTDVEPVAVASVEILP